MESLESLKTSRFRVKSILLELELELEQFECLGYMRIFEEEEHDSAMADQSISVMPASSI